MKYAHIDDNDGKILAWYSDDVHGTYISPELDKDSGEVLKAGYYDISNIPTPNIEVTNEVWENAINANAYDKDTKAFIVKDFRTTEEIAEAEFKQAKAEGEIYTLNDVDYKVPFMKDDADGLMQVNAAFQLGITNTVIYFSNGTKMPIQATEFQEFTVWFVTKRNSFFIEG